MSPQQKLSLAVMEDWFTVQKIWRPGGFKEAHESLDDFLSQATSGDRNAADIRTPKIEDGNSN